MNVPLLQFHLHMLQRKILAPHAAQEVEQTVATTSVGVNLVGWLVLKWFPGAIMSDPYLLSASIDRSMYISIHMLDIYIYMIAKLLSCSAKQWQTSEVWFFHHS